MIRPLAYYNEHDPYAAQWLRNLIEAGCIAPGVVDERSIRDVRPEDLDGFVQCHFFAGIGVWSHALRRAGWADDRPVWTGSCPCQPFSAAGQRKGTSDDRHLWPDWFRLIEVCRPPAVLGEQVASKDGLGWLDLVSTDLEGAGYAFGASDLCAAGLPAQGGGGHIRQRLYFVGLANGDYARSPPLQRTVSPDLRRRWVRWGAQSGFERSGATGRVADTRRPDDERQREPGEARSPAGTPQSEAQQREWGGAPVGAGVPSGRVADTAERGRPRQSRGGGGEEQRTSERSLVGRLALAHGGNSGAERQQRSGEHRQQLEDSGSGRVADAERDRFDWGGPRGPRGRRESPDGGVGDRTGASAPLFGWHDTDWLFCRDGKWRPVEAGFQQVVDEVATRMGPLCSVTEKAAEKVIAEAAHRFSTSRDDILRAMREGIGPEGVQGRSLRESVIAYEAALLLASLRELNWQEGDKPDASHGESAESGLKNRLRMLWEKGSSSDPSHKRGLAGRKSRKLANAVRELSSAVARSTPEVRLAVFGPDAVASFPLDGGRDNLCQNRVGKLRAYGNALDAETATGFVEAVMETMDMTDEPAPRAHAYLSPSAAHRWMVCAASAALESQVPDQASVYADEGTAAHTLAADCLLNGSDAASRLGQVIVVGEHSFTVDKDMAAHVQSYIDFIRALAEGKTLLVERRVGIGHITGEQDATGTADAIIIDASAKNLTVVDLKYGRGVEVSPVDNEQMQHYALGALEDYSILADFESVTMLVHQPRINGASEPWSVSTEELLLFADHASDRADHAMAVLKDVLDGTPVSEIDLDHYRPGEKQCRFCDGKAICPALRAEVIELVGETATAAEFASLAIAKVGLETGENYLSVAMSKVGMVEDWCKAIRAEVERRLLAGRTVDGFKLVEGRRGNRQWTDETEAEALLKSFRLKADEIYDRKLIGVASAEKLLKQTPKRWAKVEKIITRSDGKPSVAPATDKRPALAVSSIAEEFRDLALAK